MEAKHLPLVLVNVSNVTQSEGVLYEMRELKSMEMGSLLAQSSGEILFVMESAVAIALSLHSIERGDEESNRNNIVLHNTNTFSLGLSLKGSFKARFVPQDGICSLFNEQRTLAETTVAPVLVQEDPGRTQHISGSNTLISLCIEEERSCAYVSTCSSQTDFLVDVYSFLGACTLSGNGDHHAARVASLHLPKNRSGKHCRASKNSIIVDEDRGRLTRIEGLMQRMTGMHYPENLYCYETYLNNASHAVDEIPRDSKTLRPNFERATLNIEQILAEALSAIASANTKSSLIISNIVNKGDFNTATPLFPKRLGKEHGIVSGYLNNVYLEMPTVSVKKFHSDLLIQSSEKNKTELFSGSSLPIVKKVKKAVQTKKKNKIQLSNTSLVVSGGTGALGMATAAWGRALFANHVYLFSRSGVSNGHARNALTRTGFTRLEKIDGSILSDADVYHDNYRKDMPISMVFVHASGTQQAATMPHTAPNISRRVHSGKFEPIQKLLRETRPMICANFFSSISALLGNKNHASYSAANSAMDNIAIGLRVEGLPCTSTQWGAWGSIGT